MDISVEKQADGIYEVSVGTFGYKVTLTDEYWRSLTGGRISQEKLIELSFDFLLEHEGPESILGEFDLPMIKHYFPEYEDVIKGRL